MISLENFTEIEPLKLSDLDDFALAVPVQRVRFSALQEQGIELWVRRDDKLPEWCQGNKFYKLVLNLQSAPAGTTLVSFGGAFSNHIHALALMGQKFQMPTIGVIRGERPRRLSPTLADAESAGMRLCFVSRTCYRHMTALMDADSLALACSALLETDASMLWVIPEGGANEAGVEGCMRLAQTIAAQAGAQPYDDVLLAVGTGTTLAGLALGLPSSWQVSGVSVLGDVASDDQCSQVSTVQRWLQGRPTARWCIHKGFHHGGYARTTPELLSFMEQFRLETGLLLDQVYTGKLFWAVTQLALNGYWTRGTRLLAIHSGGLQGRRGLAFNTITA